jgi:hypothetical protein
MLAMASASHPRYRRGVLDRLILPLMALAAMIIIAAAMMWPQGSGRPSPPPFGHPMAPASAPVH